MLNINRKILFLIFLTISFFILGSINFNNEKTYHITKPAQIYWYASKEIANVSYYMLTEKDVVSCEYVDQTKSFMFCGWRFSYFRDPLYGWIKIESLEKK